jgi:hypothetical protein
MDAQDAYKEVGGRKRMERVFERRCHGWPYAVKYTTAGTQEVERIRRQSRRMYESGACPWMGGRAVKDKESENGFTQYKLEARI